MSDLVNCSSPTVNEIIHFAKELEPSVREGRQVLRQLKSSENMESESSTSSLPSIISKSSNKKGDQAMTSAAKTINSTIFTVANSSS